MDERLSPNDPTLPDVQSLLPTGTRIASLYEHVGKQLRAWNLPTWLVELGRVLRQVERGIIAPTQIGALLGEAAAAAAAALVAFNAPVPRIALQIIERGWKLMLLTYWSPAASVIKIAELLAQLDHTRDADLTCSVETVTMAANAAARLGMYDVRNSLRDARARLADPYLVQQARDLMNHSQPARTQFFDALQRDLSTRLCASSITAEIVRQPRSLYHVVDDGLESLRGAFPWTDIVEITAAEVEDCYRALSVINRSYPVNGDKLRDFIGGPKENGYQALHTTIEYRSVSDERTAWVELRIATPAMRRYNLDGYLAHLAQIVAPARRPIWWTNCHRWIDAYEGRSNELFIFTPAGATIFLPRGATVLDFAIRIHSDLGVFCRGALVNGRAVTPGARLECADVCEVLIDQQREVISERLLERAVTLQARSRIQRELRKDQAGVARGRKVFREALSRLLAEHAFHASETAVEQQIASICRERSYHSVDVLFRALTRGEVAPDQIARRVIESLLLPYVAFEAVPEPVRARARRAALAQCCYPRTTDAIVAVAAHGGHRLNIHRAACANVNATAYPLSWKPVEQQAYLAEALYESWDRPGLVHDVTGLLQQFGANIRMFHADVPEQSLARLRFSFEVTDPNAIEHIRRALEQTPLRRHVEVRAIKLVDGGFRITSPLNNPYGPQPVGRWPMFVGRSVEVRQIIAQIEHNEGARHVLIRGPKRIGKSSLMEHLARHHLSHFNVPPPLNLQSLPNEELLFPRLLCRMAEMLIHSAGSHAKVRSLDPDRIASNPVQAFGAFLQQLRRPPDAEREADRFVLLIDELGVITNRLRDFAQVREFFDQWRALLNDRHVYEHLSFIVALPDLALEQLINDSTRTGAWSARLGELGFHVRLAVLNDEDARDLIAAPTQMHLEYAPEDMDLLMTETGGHPYYTHLVCGQIVTAVQTQQRRGGLSSERQRIPTTLIRAALEEVCRNEDAFHHVMADTSFDVQVVLCALATMTNDEQHHVSRARLKTQLRQFDPHYGNATITRALNERPDLLHERDGGVELRAALIARWLRRTAPEMMMERFV